MPMNKPDMEQMQRAVVTSLHEHWVFFLVEGIILVILGLAAIVIPHIATLAVEILFGWLFLISGIVGLITTFWMRQAPGFWWSLVSAILGIAVGIVLLLRPLSSVLFAARQWASGWLGGMVAFTMPSAMILLAFALGAAAFTGPVAEVRGASSLPWRRRACVGASEFPRLSAQ
jgi:uncharacterized membrane protein HdeD (DUF308 family)